MPYPKLAEGNRVFDAVYDAETNFADWNELQVQLKGMMGPRVTNLPIVAGKNDTASMADAVGWNLMVEPTASGAATCEKWYTGGGNTAGPAYLSIPIHGLQSGMKITLVTALVYGTWDGAGGAEGSVGLYRRLISAAAGAPGLVASVSAAPFNGSAWSMDASAALTHTVDATYNYYLYIVSAWDNPAPNCWFGGAYATVQFGA